MCVCGFLHFVFLSCFFLLCFLLFSFLFCFIVFILQDRKNFFWGGQPVGKSLFVSIVLLHTYKDSTLKLTAYISLSGCHSQTGKV